MDNVLQGIPVLYLSYDGLTDPLGQSQILPYLSGLAKKGYRITIVSFEKPDRYTMGSKEIQAYCNREGLVWIPLKYHKFPPVLSTLFDLYRLFQVCRRYFKIVHTPVILHCRSYITSIVGLLLKRKYRAKFIFDMRGFWVDERVDGKIWDLKNPIFSLVYKYFKRKEVQFLRESDHIISLTEKAKHEILSWNIGPAAITVIPTCTDLTLFDTTRITETQKIHLRSGLKLNADDFVLIYIGSWGSWYLTDDMLRFFSALKKHKPAAKLLVVTLDNVTLDGYAHRDEVIVTSCSRKEIPVAISIASLAVYFIKPAFSKIASSATKLGELIAMQIPVITNCGVGDVEEILKAYGDGFLVTNFEDAEYEKAIETLLNKRREEKNTTLYRYFDLARGIELYSNVYKQVFEPVV